MSTARAYTFSVNQIRTRLPSHTNLSQAWHSRAVNKGERSRLAAPPGCDAHIRAGGWGALLPPLRTYFLRYHRREASAFSGNLVTWEVSKYAFSSSAVALRYSRTSAG
jgi:hypothetical protein